MIVGYAILIQRQILERQHIFLGLYAHTMMDDSVADEA